MRRRVSARVVFAAATSLLGLSLLGVLADPLPSGLRASYFRTGDLSGPPAAPVVSETPSTYNLFRAWHGKPPPTFSAQWSGWILVPRDGDYTFATISDDASAIVVDGQSVVDNGGVHGARAASGTRRLARGVHNLYVSYTQSGGELALELLWARGDAPLAPLPAWALAPRAATYPRMAVSAFLRRLLPVVLWIWLPATVAAIAMGIARPIGRSLAAGNWRAAFEWTLVFGAGAVLIFVMPHRITSDAYVRYFALAQLIEWREVSDMLYSFIGPFCAAPLYFLGGFIGSPVWWCARFNAMVLAGGVAVLWQLLRREVDGRLFRTFALLLLTASMFPNHVLDFFGEPLTTVLVAVGLVAVERGFPIAGWAAAIVGVANTPATMVGLAAAAAVRAWRTRRLRPFIAVALAAALIMLETWLRRGILLHGDYVATAGNRTVLTYSGRPGFSYPLFFGLLSVLFSFGKGLVFYAPGLLLAASDRLRAAGERHAAYQRAVAGVLDRPGPDLLEVVGVVRRVDVGSPVLPGRVRSRVVGARGSVAADRSFERRAARRRARHSDAVHLGGDRRRGVRPLGARPVPQRHVRIDLLVRSGIQPSVAAVRGLHAAVACAVGDRRVFRGRVRVAGRAAHAGSRAARSRARRRRLACPDPRRAVARMRSATAHHEHTPGLLMDTRPPKQPLSTLC